MRELTWFHKWIIEGFSIRQLEKISPHKSRKLRNIINEALNNPPDVLKEDLHHVKHLIFDGTFLFKRVGILVLMNAVNRQIVYGKFRLKENSKPDLLVFFNPLIKKGLSPKTITVDGNPQVMNLIKKLWPEIIIQRCLVHIQRQGLMWCRQNPSRWDAKQLRKLFLTVMHIKTHKDKNRFLNELNEWEEKFGRRLKDEPSKGWVQSDLKKARSMLIRALPNMFHYLDDNTIPKTTNALESYFSRLKNHYRQHRGLAAHKRENYFDWFFVLRSK